MIKKDNLSDDSINISVAIIGAGPSGIACAIQLKRQGITPLVFEKHKIGGLLLNANLVENYPGFVNGISGTELCNLLELHFNKLGLVTIKKEVINLKYIDYRFLITTENDSYKADKVVIASGTKPIKTTDFQVDFETQSKILYEIESIIDVKNQVIAIVGAGDAAFDYALNMSKKNKVYILNCTDEIKCLNLLFERTKLSPNIDINNNVSVLNVNYINNCLMIYLSNNSTLIADYLIYAIGREPNLDFIDEAIRENINELEKDNKLFFIGDVKNKNYRQTSIAIGDGIKAAMKLAPKPKKTCY
jgi:thioredoxin reductase (NADPH)